MTRSQDKIYEHMLVFENGVGGREFFLKVYTPIIVSRGWQQ
jgi:hypothetical protein